MKRERATKKQQELLSFVDGFIREHGYGPSYREIMAALGYKSVSTVAVHIDGLITKGYLIRRDNSPRSLELAHVQESSSVPESTNKVLEEFKKALHLHKDQADQATLLKALHLLGYENETEKLKVGDA
ncbi:MAG TPA: hypothetical protein VGE34_03895 [Candidatus Saccharimonadales bacterium]